MNTVNNKRRQASKEKIEKVFVELLQQKELTQITVSDICKITGLNRSTFYANYEDIYGLADTIRRRLEEETGRLYHGDTVRSGGFDYLELFRHVRDNQLFYSTYFKLGYDSKHTVDLSRLTRESRIFPDEQLEYHIEFHKAGLNAVIKKWLASGCRETPETVAAIIRDEYTNRR